MRIALVHSFYSSAAPSGENLVVLDQAAALRRAGHDVHLVSVSTDELSRSRWYPARSALTVATGRGRDPLAQLRRIDPEVTHVHNLFPNYGERWVRDWDGPLVCTVHNVRPVCAAGTFVRDGRACTDCLTAAGPLPALRHRCYRGSAVATAPLVWAQRIRPPRQPLLSRADRILVPADRVRTLWARTGVPEDRLHVLPHFVPGPRTPTSPATARTSFVWAGRLSPEKGLADLLRAWPDRLPLTVLGDGPERDRCERMAPASVRFLGAVTRADVDLHLAAAGALIVTTRCMETFGLVAAEALARGTPVVALRGSTIADLVEEHAAGVVVDDVDDIADAATTLDARGPTLREHCHQVHADEFSEPVWTRRVSALFEALLEPSGTRLRLDDHHDVTPSRRPL
jgi:glycosyltransferase involved in cell wall biosynthesis